MPARRTAGRSSLPGAVKVGYGAGSAGIAATEFFIRIYVLKLYIDILGLSPSLAGTALAVALIWEVVTDPLVGELSDRTRSRFGRRRPWIAAGAVLGAVAFVALFRPPSIGSQVGLAAWLLGSYVLFSTVMTMLAVPHAALGGELASDPGTRNEIFGWRFLFTNLGLVAGIVFPAAVTGDGGDATAAAPWLGLVVVSGAFVAIRVTRGRDQPDASGTGFSFRALLESLRSVTRSRPFRPLLGAYMIGSVALTVNSALALFYYEHRLGLGEREVFLAILLPFALVIALSIGGWVILSRRFGRRWTAFAGVLVMGVGSSIVYPLLPAGSLLLPMAWGLIGGALVGSVFLLDAAVADVVDHEEAVRGVHREGLYFGIWRMGSKLARALGLALAGFLLQFIGFVPGAPEQTAAVRSGLAFAFGPGVGVLWVAAALTWLLFPLTERTQERIQRILARRRGPRGQRDSR